MTKKKSTTKMRTTSVTIVDRKGSESITLGIQFENVADLISKIDEAIDNTEWRKVYVTVDTMDFSNEEIEELNENDIF